MMKLPYHLANELGTIHVCNNTQLLTIAHRSDPFPLSLAAGQGMKGLALGWIILGSKAR